MIKNENSNESISKWHHCGTMWGGRNSGVFWGILFIVVGLYWFGKIAGWFAPEVITMFWPIILVVIGVLIIGATLIRKRNAL